jgi:hypothetical protein
MDLQKHYVWPVMRILPVTAKGQITLRNELLRRLGARPGEKSAVSKLPGGQIVAGKR